MMIGKIHGIPMKEGKQCPYAFIKAGDKDYFLHRSDLFDSWDQLKQIIANEKVATIEFEFTTNEKGPRAVGAKIIR